MTERWKWWCSSCGTVTDDSRECDCTRYTDRPKAQKLEPYPFASDEDDRNGKEQSR